jgi:hypothetical protein
MTFHGRAGTHLGSKPNNDTIVVSFDEVSRNVSSQSDEVEDRPANKADTKNYGECGDLYEESRAVDRIHPPSCLSMPSAIRIPPVASIYWAM